MSILKNEHGTWGIERITTERGYRWNLYFWDGSKWVHIANQGKRSTCVELATIEYRLKVLGS